MGGTHSVKSTLVSDDLPLESKELTERDHAAGDPAQSTTVQFSTRPRGPGFRRRSQAVDQIAVTVIVRQVWAVTSDPSGWLPGWRRADSRLPRRLLGPDRSNRPKINKTAPAPRASIRTPPLVGRVRVRRGQPWRTAAFSAGRCLQPGPIAASDLAVPCPRRAGRGGPAGQPRLALSKREHRAAGLLLRADEQHRFRSHGLITSGASRPSTRR
jgi:hypothetical protein